MCIWPQACSWRLESCKLEYGWDASSHIKPYRAINTEIMSAAWFLLDIPFSGSLYRKVLGHSSHLCLLEPGRSVKALRLHLPMWVKGRLDEPLDETSLSIRFGCDTAVKPVWRQLVQLPFLLLARGFRDKGVAKEHLCVSMRQHASASETLLYKTLKAQRSLPEEGKCRRASPRRAMVCPTK
jgi:hypothetical protein